jgi:hypothetical protein
VFSRAGEAVPAAHGDAVGAAVMAAEAWDAAGAGAARGEARR